MAGVSLNAIVGDNGIITNAMNATYAESCAMLEEYLQQFYVQNLEKMEDTDASKVITLQSMRPEWFFSTNLGYIPDSNGNALYLINKSGLPDEVKKELKGGEAGDGLYSSYANLIDVYGVTSDLKVYYCSNGIETVYGISPDMLDQDDTSRTVASNSADSIGSSLLNYDSNGDGKLSVQEARSVKSTTIEGENLKDLSEIGSLVSLQTLVLKNAKLEDLSGMEKCSKLYYIYFRSCTIKNYSALSGLRNQLTHLIFVDVNDDEISNFCSKNVGIGNYDFSKLTYLAITGYTETSCMFSISGWNDIMTQSNINGDRNVDKYITSVSFLKNLTDATKKNVKYLCLSSNELTTLEGIEDFSNLNMIRAEKNKLNNVNSLGEKKLLTWINLYSNKLEDLNWITSDNNINYLDVMYNSITTTKGISKAKNLVRIFIRNNKLGEGVDNPDSKNLETDALSEISKCTKLYLFDGLNNINLRWVDYLKDISTLKYLYLDGCTSLDGISLATLKQIINECIKCSYPSKYALSLVDTDTTNLNLSNETISEDVFEALIPQFDGNRLVSGLGNIVTLDLYNLNFTKSGGAKLTPTESNSLMVRVLSSLKTLKRLRVYASSPSYSTSELSSDSFIGEDKIKDLEELFLQGVSLPNLVNLNSNSFSLKILFLLSNRVEFDFSTMQDVINNIYDNQIKFGGERSYFDWNNYGFEFDGTVSNSFINLTKVKGLYLCYPKSNEDIIDLSGFTNLVDVKGYRWFVGSSKLILPKSLTTYQLWHPGFGYADFSNCTNLREIPLEDHAEFDYNDLHNVCLSIKKMFENAEKEGKENFCLDRFWFDWSSTGTVPSFDFLEPLSGLNIYNFEATFRTRYNASNSRGLGYLNKARSIKLTGTMFNVLEGLTPVYNDGILVSGCPDLETFSCIDGTNLADVSDLGGCTKLKSITIANCSLSNIYGFQNLKELEYCYLKNNSLMNLGSYIDSQGESHNYDVLDIFVNLNQNFKLKSLYISGNGFDTLTKISSLNWKAKDF